MRPLFRFPQTAKLIAAFIVAAFTLSAQTPFVSSFTPARVRNDFSGWVGTMFTVSQPITVTALGRICAAGNSGTHAVEIYQAGAGALVAASVSMNGCAPGQFVYVNIPPGLPLAVGTPYYLATQETAGGDRWYDYGGSAIQVSTGMVTGSVYQYAGQTAWNPVGVPNTAYGPPNFQYTPTQPSPAPAPTPSPVAGPPGTSNGGSTSPAPGDGLIQSSSGTAYDPTVIPTHDTIHANENFCASSNGTSAYTCSLPQKALQKYSLGETFLLLADATCTASCTLNIDGVGVKTITKNDGVSPPAGHLIKGQAQWVWYDGTVFRLMY